MSAPKPTFPTLTLEQARSALTAAIAAFAIPANAQKMQDAIAAAGDDPMKKMMTLLPLVQEIQVVEMEKYGFVGPGAVMAATTQIQGFAKSDEEIAKGVKVLFAKLSGA